MINPDNPENRMKIKVQTGDCFVPRNDGAGRNDAAAGTSRNNFGMSRNNFGTSRKDLRTFRKDLRTFLKDLRTFLKDLRTFLKDLRTFLKDFRASLKGFRESLKDFGTPRSNPVFASRLLRTETASCLAVTGSRIVTVPRPASLRGTKQSAFPRAPRHCEVRSNLNYPFKKSIYKKHTVEISSK
jgi:hypothetical protein